MRSLSWLLAPVAHDLEASFVPHLRQLQNHNPHNHSIKICAHLSYCLPHYSVLQFPNHVQEHMHTVQFLPIASSCERFNRKSDSSFVVGSSSTFISAITQHDDYQTQKISCTRIRVDTAQWKVLTSFTSVFNWFCTWYFCRAQFQVVTLLSSNTKFKTGASFRARMKPRVEFVISEEV